MSQTKFINIKSHHFAIISNGHMKYMIHFFYFVYKIKNTKKETKNENLCCCRETFSIYKSFGEMRKIK